MPVAAYPLWYFVFAWSIADSPVQDDIWDTYQMSGNTQCEWFSTHLLFLLVCREQLLIPGVLHEIAPPTPQDRILPFARNGPPLQPKAGIDRYGKNVEVPSKRYQL